MSILRHIYESLATTILTYTRDPLKSPYKVNHVAMYQGQDLHQEKELGFKPPVVFIKFGQGQATQLVAPIQQITLPITIYLVTENYTENYILSIDQQTIITRALNNSPQDWQFAILRTYELPDANANALNVFETGYLTNYYDTTGFDNDETLIGGTSGFDYGINLSIYMNEPGENNGTQGWTVDINI